MSLTIESRFCGPPSSGNGGYSCGVAAGLIPDGVVEVTLRSPPPLDRPLRADGTRLYDGETLIAEAAPGKLAHAPAPFVPFDVAERAARGYPGFDAHPYPTCFVCGTRRDDGLRIFPGAVDGMKVAASPWTPDASVTGDDGRVRREILWAVLDCPSFFGWFCFDRDAIGADAPVLLGRLTAEIVEAPRAGERCVCTAQAIGRDGRKVFASSAIWSADGRRLASAEAIWILPKR
jgi:hypothetical protein